MSDTNSGVTAPNPEATPRETDKMFLSDSATPRWIKDVFRFLPVKSQFLLSGNVRDRYPFPLADGNSPVTPSDLFELAAAHEDDQFSDYFKALGQEK